MFVISAHWILCFYGSWSFVECPGLLLVAAFVIAQLFYLRFQFIACSLVSGLEYFYLSILIKKFLSTPGGRIDFGIIGNDGFLSFLY
ncbi:unnamed protein product [Prunus armeniaca]|uniref:Uncharacterized protein n=1 Tax=Prunus armeniaca TaxID=36596 RepID=A0A6J5W6R6_PRUAR|nr:unnamed protein product [Prunus armeniaca]